MNKKSWIIIVAQFLLFAFILGSVVKCNNDTIESLEHNIGAYKDQIEYVTNQNGELIAQKESLILSESEMREELDKTKKEINRLEKNLGDNLAYIAKLESNAHLPDTVYLKPDSVVIENDITKKSFSFNDDWLKMNATVFGKSLKDSQLTLDNLWMNTNLEVGLTDNYSFWVKSDNPYLQINDIKGVVVENSSVDRKEKRLHHGIHIGIGLQYGLINKSWDIGPSVTYGFTYSF